jgi:hypothetical protein
MIFNYRRRQTYPVVECLHSIISAAAMDPKRRIIDYLKSMDPPTYNCQKYFDWIIPYVYSIKEESIKYIHMMTSKY